jgi:hypothetical protein
MKPIFLDTLDRLQLWLLSDALQLDRPAHCVGGVPGWWIAGQSPQWVYLEITGYYLTHLRFVAERSPALRDEVIDRMHASLAWIDRVVTPQTVPPTRLYTGDAPAEWRNQAVFSFDLGMALRGCEAARIVDESRALAARDRLLTHLSSLVGTDRVIDSHHMLDGTKPESMAERWSTRRGPHHVKVAGGIALATDDPAWQDIAMETARHHADCNDSHTRDLHPCAYFMEGLLQLWVHTGDIAWLDRCEAIFRAVERHPHLPDREGLERGDVTAQLLRISAVLRGEGRLPDNTFSQSLRERLIHFVAPDGSMRFHSLFAHSERQQHVNTWAGMFAHQALAFDERAMSGAPVPAEWIRWIV